MNPIVNTKFNQFIAIIYFKNPIKIPLLYLKKCPELTAVNNYFQTEEYLNETNILGVL